MIDGESRSRDRDVHPGGRGGGGVLLDEAVTGQNGLHEGPVLC
jgi:hypothetical protein